MKVLRINGHRIKCAFCKRYAKDILDGAGFAVCTQCGHAYITGFLEREFIMVLKDMQKEGCDLSDPPSPQELIHKVGEKV